MAKKQHILKQIKKLDIHVVLKKCPEGQILIELFIFFSSKYTGL